MTLTEYSISGVVTDCNNAQNSSTGIVTNRYYYHTNQLGSIIALTNSGGTVMQVYSYDSFGKAYVVTGSGTGTTATDIKSYTGNTYSNSRLYTGREYDKETNLYYLRARYYNQNTGKFISRDPIGQNDQINLYTYVKNSPLGYTDRDGRKASQLLAWIGDVADSIFRPEQTYGDLNPSPIVEKDIGIVGEAVVIGGGLLLPGGKKKAGETFFEGAIYSKKALEKAGRDIYHGFPTLIDDLAKQTGKVKEIVGGDTKTYQKLILEGSINGVKGTFEYIKKGSEITHGFFNQL